MLWISFILLSFSLFAKDLPRFLTKHPIESIRFITLDGRFAYVQKRPGVLGLINSFRSVDFISETSKSDFLVKDSRFKRRLIIETIPDAQEYNLIKNHKIGVVELGKTLITEIGFGKGSRLHLDDEWITFYDGMEKQITIQNILTQKKYFIKLPAKTSPFFMPEVEMVSSDTVVYTDVNDRGFVALISYNLVTQKSTIIYKSSQSGTRIELCQAKGYMGIGEFPYDDIARGSKILLISGSNLAGYTTAYSSTDADLGNMICVEGAIYFVKTLTHQKKINFKVTEAVRLDLKTTKVQTITEMGAVTQIISMDGRILIPFRGDFHVLEGSHNLSDDKLKSPSSPQEELPLEI